MRAAPEPPKEISAFALRYKGFQSGRIAAIWVVPRRCLRPNVIFMAGMEAFFIFRGFPVKKTLLN